MIGDLWLAGLVLPLRYFTDTCWIPTASALSKHYGPLEDFNALQDLLVHGQLTC